MPNSHQFHSLCNLVTFRIKFPFSEKGRIRTNFRTWMRIKKISTQHMISRTIGLPLRSKNYLIIRDAFFTEIQNWPNYEKTYAFILFWYAFIEFSYRQYSGQIIWPKRRHHQDLYLSPRSDSQAGPPLFE